MIAARLLLAWMIAPTVTVALVVSACGAAPDPAPPAEPLSSASAAATSCTPVNWAAATNDDCNYTSPCHAGSDAGDLCDDGYRAYWEPLRKLLHCEHWTNTSGDPLPLRGISVEVKNTFAQTIFRMAFGDQSAPARPCLEADAGDSGTSGITSNTTDWSNPSLRARIASSTKAVAAITALKSLRDAYPGKTLSDILAGTVGAALDAELCGTQGATDIPVGSSVRDITIGQLMSFTSGLGDGSKYDLTGKGPATASCVGDSSYPSTRACACEILTFAHQHQSRTVADPAAVNPLAEELPLVLRGGSTRPESFYFHRPGYAFKYHDQHTTVLAAIVGLITGATMNDLLDRKIARPLGINTAESRVWFFGNSVTAAYLGTDNNPSYAADLASTVPEFVTFEGMIAGRGVAYVNGQVARVVEQEVIDTHETAGFPGIQPVPLQPSSTGGYFAPCPAPCVQPAWVVALISPTVSYPSSYAAGGAAAFVPTLYGRNTWLRALHVNTAAGYSSIDPSCLFGGACPFDRARPYADDSVGSGLIKSDAFVVDSLTHLGPVSTDAYQWLGHDGKMGWTPWVDRTLGLYGVIGKYRPSGSEGAASYAAGDTAFSKTIQLIVQDLARAYGTNP